MDGSKFTQKTNEALSSASELATERSHQQVTPLHVATALFEDAEGLAKTAVKKFDTNDTWRAILRVLNRKLVRLPSISPAPDEVFASSELRKCMQQASKLQKKRNDSYLGVDVLLHAVLGDKEVSSALVEAGVHKGQVETALDDVRGPEARIESATGDEQYEALEKYGTDLTARAANLDPVIGRDDEIRRVIRVLCRRTKNNPVLIGDPGRSASHEPVLHSRFCSNEGTAAVSHYRQPLLTMLACHNRCWEDRHC